MAEDARTIANFIIELAWSRKKDITHLSLQKILFFSHAWYLGKYNEPLIGQKFEAWQHGPVSRVVYNQMKRFKDRPITERLTKIDADTGVHVEASSEIPSEVKKYLESIYQYYDRYSAFDLVRLTHEVGGPWEDVWNKSVDNPVPGMQISDEAIRLWILRVGRHGDRTALN